MFFKLEYGSYEGVLFHEKSRKLNLFQSDDSNIPTYKSTVIKLIKRNNKKGVIVRDSSCLNCEHPFFGNEKFCPECGQANKGNKITFGNFIYELFNGFFSFDAKFWRTIIPLLTNPGKVSQEYVTGKRNRYSNPFRFYLTVSILFFLVLGLSKSIDKYHSLKNGSTSENTNLFNFDIPKTNNIEIDSLKNAINKELENGWTSLDSLNRKEIIDTTGEAKGDSPEININNFTFLGFNLDELINYQRKYPNSTIDNALDSLKLEKKITNRFLYSRVKAIVSIANKNESQEQFINQMLSYSSVALFILLPLFTIFLKLLYIRKKYTYIDHLIFVFHTQTVFFMFLSIVFLISFFTDITHTWIILLLFLMYLFLAMKKFYHQGYLKTSLKFLFLNTLYIFMSAIGVAAVGFISFTLY